MDFKKEVESIKALSHQMMPFSFPFTYSVAEDELNAIRSKYLTLDGYFVILHHSKNNYGLYYLETLQILSVYNPILPRTLYHKIARKFFEEETNLFFIEIRKEQHQIYCWSHLTEVESVDIIDNYKLNAEKAEFEGFEYWKLKSEQINFY